MVYILIFQKPLKIQVYSSLVALFEDNDINELGVSKSKLDKWDWNFNYIAHNIIISKREALTSGDVRRKVENEINDAYNKGIEQKGCWIKDEFPK